MYGLFNRLLLRLSSGFFYFGGPTNSAATLVFCVAFAVDNLWLAQTGLIVILILLLVSGILLLMLGIRDLMRDLRHFLQERSRQNNHASL